MSSELDSIKTLLENSDFSIADFEFIVRYLKKENISAQLAMRRIKAFDKLQEKLEDNSDKEEIKKLRQNLSEEQKQLEAIKNEIALLEHKKKEWENKSTLLSSEAEQLREQLDMLQQLHMSDIEEENKEQQALIDSVTKLSLGLKDLLNQNEYFEIILSPIIGCLSLIAEEKPFEFDKQGFVSNFEDNIISKIHEKVDVNDVVESKTSIEKSIAQDSTINVEKEATTRQKQESKKNEPEEKISSDIKEEKFKDKEDKKEIATQKEEEEENKVPKKTQEVLTLFIDFIDEANTDEEFKKRVAAICDTDEAYETLGSIALSQVYSFKTKSKDKKPQLVKLLKSWMKSGVPW
ncbi:MAG: hypothetical protein INQ03_07175 [Candidatus Heimdallarchaeota archaeon]|nr:hypothetical protein [Candidatus Heimdallarchaeota archaeon]